MNIDQKFRWLPILLVFALVFTCVSPAPAAHAENAASHSIVERTYPFYIGKEASDMLNQEFPLYFIDGADDLPYVDVADWAELLYFINTDLNGDPGYDLGIEYNDGVVTLERESLRPLR